jgi:hypothetical protein
MSLHIFLPPLLKSQLAAGRVVPFLGAGISRNAGLPDWPGLLRDLVAWAASVSIVLESPDLILSAIEKGHLDIAAHALGEVLGDKLPEGLSSILAPPDLQPTLTHRLLANVVWPAVITTNFDNLVPKCFGESSVLTWKDQEAIGHMLKTGQPHSMMAHGWINRPETIVLTPQGYRESFRKPALQHYMKTVFSQYSVLFLGFSLNDYDLKFFLEELRYAFGPTNIPHFALLPTDRVDELALRHLRDNYGIEVISYTASESHPQVEQFAKLVIDQVPQHFFRDPLMRVDELKAVQASRASMSTSEYLNRFRETCERLAQSGFVRTAWTALNSELDSATSMSATERIETRITATEMMIEDRAIDLAYPALNELLGVINNPEVDVSLKIRFETVVFRVCLDGYLLNDARHALKRAQHLGIPHPEIGRMAAELALADFLHSGPLDPAPQTNNTHELGARAESLAMQGHLDDALAYLANQADALRSGSPIEAGWVRVKRAELFFLDCHHEDAWNELDEQVQPLKSCFSVAERTTFERNQSFVGLLLGRTGTHRRFYVAVDQESTTKQDTAHLHHLLGAEQASREQKHYESLPPLWRELLRAYREGDWNGRKRAHQRLAWETLAAGWIREATHHTILGGNSSCGQQLVEGLIQWQKPELTEVVLTYVLKHCFLTSHIEPAADIITLMADIIADHHLPAVIDWILRAISQPVTNREAERCAIGVWKLAERLTFRWSQEQALKVLHAARSHPFLREHGWGRRAVLKTMRACLNRITDYDWSDFAGTVLPLATTERWDADYENVLTVLREIARRNSNARDLIAATLWPTGTASRDVQLALLAPELGRTIAPESLKQILATITQRLPLQVWSGTGDPPPFELGLLMTQESEHEGEKIRIVVLGGNDHLDFVTAHKESLPQTELAALFDVVCELIVNPLNIRANRIMLINFITEMRQRLTPEQAEAALVCLWEFANGTAPASPVDLPKPSTTDRAKWEMPTPEQQQTIAIRAIINISVHFPQHHRSEYSDLLKDAFLHQSPLLRQVASAGIMEVPQRTPEMEFLLVTAIQDHEVDVSATALHAATFLCGNGALEAHTQLLIVVAERSFRSPHPQIRRLTIRLAIALSKLTGELSHQAILSGILSKAKADPHHTVRSATD